MALVDSEVQHINKKFLNDLTNTEKPVSKVLEYNPRVSSSDGKSRKENQA